MHGCSKHVQGVRERVENTALRGSSVEGQQGRDVAAYSARAVRYDDIYRMDEISFHIMFYRLFRGVAKYIVTLFTFHHLSDCNLYTPPTTGREEETERPARTQRGARS